MAVARAVDSRFRLDEATALILASTFGTPLYVIDEGHFRLRVRRYLAAFRSARTNGEISFASKANSTLAVLAIAHQEGCSIDVASEGELRAALAAGVPASHCHLHGNNKQRDEIAFALSAGIGQIVVDNFGEIETIHELTHGQSPKLMLRLAPGVDPVTHEKISTGQADTKFGFNIADGSAEKAVQRCLELGLDLYGFHCHVGSQLVDPEAQRAGGEFISVFAVEMKKRLGFAARCINIGGGLGVRYTDDEQPMEIEEYNRLVVDAVEKALEDSGLEPIIAQEPGRALIAESGVTLYRVGVVKTVPAKRIGTRTYVVVDGGLSDNPRPALYGSKYSVERVSPATTQPLAAVTIAGKHCESDKLFDDVPLPSNVGPGDLLQVLSTGAYNSSMSSNYNRYPRPATVLIRENGEFALVVRRDTWAEMLSRESLPSGLA